MFEFIKLEKQEIKEDGGLMLFELENSRIYGKLLLEDLGLYFGWRSDIVEPLILYKTDANLLLIAVDEQLCLLNYKDLNVNFNDSLNYSIVQIEWLEDFLYVFTELEVVEFDLSNMKMQRTIVLDEIYSSHQINNNVCVVKSIDGVETDFIIKTIHS